jgi:hypothetical protein
MRGLFKLAVGALVVAVGYAVKRVGERLQTKPDVNEQRRRQALREISYVHRDARLMNERGELQPVRDEYEWLIPESEMAEWLGAIHDPTRWN